MAGFYDLFQPYTPKIYGGLIEYLRDHDGTEADNNFRGSRYFFVLKNRKLLIPGVSIVRVSQNPIPDIGYVVNAQFLLESSGRGRENMSFVGAEKGVYDPKIALKGRLWSVSGLDWYKMDLPT